MKAGGFADAEDKLCGTVIRCQYDRMDRLTEESLDGEAVGYSYDMCENHIKNVDKNGSEVYTYNEKNEMKNLQNELNNLGTERAAGKTSAQIAAEYE